MRFPLAQRELARLSRSRHIHVIRGLLVAAIAGLVFVEWLPRILEIRHVVDAPEQFGTLLHMYCLLVQVTVLLVVLPVLTAPAIASERSGGTLSLLLLADFRGRDILLAKGISVLLEAGFLLLALIPVQYMSTIFGGVAPDVLAAQSLAIVVLAFFTIMLSMLSSCLVRNITGAVFLAFFMNTIFLGAVYVLDFKLNEFLGFVALRDLFFEFHTPVMLRYRRALIILGAMGIAFAVAVLFLIPRLAIDRPRRYIVGAPTPYGHTARRMLRWGPVLPILSVHATGITSTLRTPGVRVTVAMLLTVVGCVPVVGTLIIAILLIHEVTASLIAARRTGALDDLRITLIAPDLLARDVFNFYWCRGMVYLPALGACAVHLAVFADVVRFSAEAPERDWMAASLGVGLAYLVSLVASVIALGFAQLFAIVNVAAFVAVYGGNIRRQGAIAIAVVGLAYALCAYSVQCQDYLVKQARVDDAWFRVPLVLAGCAVVFGVVGLAFRAELRAFFHNGWRRDPVRFHWRSIMHVFADTR